MNRKSRKSANLIGNQTKKTKVERKNPTLVKKKMESHNPLNQFAHMIVSSRAWLETATTNKINPMLI